MRNERCSEDPSLAGAPENTIVPMLRVGMPFWTLCVLCCIPTLESEEREVFGRSIFPQARRRTLFPAGAPENTIVPMLRVGMPFWTLCVLCCIPTLEHEQREMF
ncbi:hypothetical protein BKM30_24240 [Pseudomonas syringae pv. syringae]|nr:hypothetical protein BKM27_24465 [Pseudomonas syringae pv. syringae]POR74430.1 hypothetical protein BKM30_24240 [Pseudomonas syringae pv. syringae]